MQQPLASRMRPTSLVGFVGQQEIIGENAPLTKLITHNKVPSMVFWGPPGTGKTTLAEIIAHEVSADFQRLSAVTEGKDALKKIISTAQKNKEQERQTILFIDEIHRWNKAQQDALLPYVENGTIILIGATTENPSFSIIAPLLSRTRVFIFKEHTPEAIQTKLREAAEHLNVKLSSDVSTYISDLAHGDLRFALNSFEIAIQIAGKKTLTKEIVEVAMQRYLRYDKNGEEHYNIISAVHKSLRSSNATAAVYWIVRMLEAGEDPLYIARRLVRFASEDIGNAQTNALLLANQVFQTCKNIGMPECGVALVQLAEYLAKAPKNNAAYNAYQQAVSDVKKYGALGVPLHLRNAPTAFMKDIGYGRGYEYDHDLTSKKSEQECLPDELKGRNYFTDSE
ncbi:MAG: replication-associated recombination protein A [Candidatus Dojkabacteria bacterium]|nr:MAG: replication-associated recombination protein A [Candidatus Dojkabacteria bacterium]